jgi:protein O-mannosyl-transferase
MAKQMLVTVPFVLLLLDLWPLGRLHGLAPGRPIDLPLLRADFGRLVLEKVPFFLTSAAASAVAYLVQSAGRATATIAAFPLGQRLANALVSYVLYLRRTFWPAGLAAFYPHPDTIGRPVSTGSAAAAAALLLALTVLCLWRIREQPYLAVGWLWFLGMLVPVIGLVQIGSQALADRYTYLPLLGIFAAVCWGARDLLRRCRVSPRAAAAAASAAVLALAVPARLQAAVWRDGATLYTHAIRVTDRNWLAWNNLGMQELASPEEAARCFREAVSIKPDYADAWYNLGVALGSEGRHAEAASSYRVALGLEPGNADGWVNLANEDRALGNPASAAAEGETALRFRPGDPLALSGLVLSDLARGDVRRAREDLARLRAADPEAASALEARLPPPN